MATPLFPSFSLGASSGLTGFSGAAGFSLVSGAAFPPEAGADWAALPAAFAVTALPSVDSQFGT